ncbi:MAG: bile acid:sodium symporter family protein [candidate division KSB1 bacterium]|nr:bile acid:sodium symporter family protein [candidate division KSB1 bacterium]
MKQLNLRRIAGLLAVMFLLIALLLWAFTDIPLAPPFVVGFFVCLALYFHQHHFLKKFAFTAWVFVFVSASLLYPAAFGSWFGFDLGILIVPLIQIIMFGMGTTLSVKDFTRVFTMPWPILLGIVLQFSIMPLAGLSIATLFGFEPEVAAGVILIGSCPGGVASNLMTFLAGGNVALSVTMTSCSTLLSPVATPFLMETLAGRLVPIDFVAMMLSILNMIIVPILAGLFANQILYGKSALVKRGKWLLLIGIIGLAVALVSILIRAEFWGALAALRNGSIIGFALIGVVALAKYVINALFNGPENWMDKVLPVVSMAGICFIIGIITARSSEKLLSVGLALIAAAILHNFIGYILGYWLARAARLDESSCRTVAFEVGMQNGGMASGLAMTVLKSANAALAPAIFGPWMNISGSMLSTWWHRKPAKPQESEQDKTIKTES